MTFLRFVSKRVWNNRGYRCERVLLALVCLCLFPFVFRCRPPTVFCWVGAANGFIEGSCDTIDGCGVEVEEGVEVDAENGFSDGSCDTMDG